MSLSSGSKLWRQESDSLVQRHHNMTANTKSPGLTSNLLLAAFSTTVGTWYFLGVVITNINAPQDVIVKWIRSVECQRRNYTHALDSDLWCHTAYYNQTRQLLKENLTLNSLWAMIGSSLVIACFISIWLANLMISRLGMKVTFYICNAVVAVGVVICGCCVAAQSHEMFIVGRFVIGIGLGVSLPACNIYVAEISPVRLRGAVCTIPCFLYGAGMLTAAILGLPQILGGEDTWTGLSWFLFVPIILHFISLPFCPESPRFLLLLRKDSHSGEKALQWLRKRSDVGEEIQLIENEGHAAAKQPIVSVIGLFRDSFLRRNIFICMAIMVDQRFTGYTAVYTYSTAIFSSAGLARLDAMYGTIGLMVLQIVSNVVGMVLMDRIGRRKLFIAGNIGCAVTMIMLTVFSSLVKSALCRQCQWGGLASVLVFIILFGIGPASVPWVLTTEMFDKSSRSSAMIVVSACCHAAGGTVAAVFPLMLATMDEYSFLMFAGIMAAFTVFFWWAIVETKGKTFSEIQEILWQKYNKHS